MDGNNSAYTSWADQWDTNPDAYPAETKKGSSGNLKAKYGKKVGDGLGKTKVVASNGMKKVKEGTSLGLQWIKDKYRKTTQKH